MKDIRQAAMDRDTEELFSVYQFFPNGSYERSDRLPAKNAIETAYQWTHNVAAMAGITRRVIITDDGDSTVFEWLAGKGVVYPTPEMRQEARDYRKYTKH